MVEAQISLRTRPVELEDGKWAVPLLKSRGLDGCELTFANLCLWRKYYNNTLVEVDDCLFIRAFEPPNPDDISFSALIRGDLRRGIDALRRIARDRGRPLTLYGSRQNLVDELERVFPGEFQITSLPDEYDYLYRVEELRDLPGKKFHGKRGHIAAFSRRCQWRYESLDDSNAEEVLAAAEEWYASREPLDGSLRAERNGIGDLLRHRRLLDVQGGLIRADGRVVAFTCGAPVSDTEFDVMIEKALPAYADAYPVINREFVANALGAFTYVNRENDMGIPGLRQAKLSYHPDHLIEKFVCVER